MSVQFNPAGGFNFGGVDRVKNNQGFQPLANADAAANTDGASPIADGFNFSVNTGNVMAGSPVTPAASKDNAAVSAVSVGYKSSESFAAVMAPAVHALYT